VTNYKILMEFKEYGGRISSGVTFACDKLEIDRGVLIPFIQADNGYYQRGCTMTMAHGSTYHIHAFKLGDHDMVVEEGK